MGKDTVTLQTVQRVTFFALAICLAATVNVAAAQSVALEWIAPEDCARSEDVMTQLRALAGENGAPPMAVRAEVTHSHSWKMSLTFPEAAAREFEASSCAELVDVATIVLSMWLTNEQAANVNAPTPPAVEAAPTVPAATDPETPWQATPETETSGPRDHRWIVRAEAEVAVGSVPALAGGARVGAGVEGTYWNVETALRYLAPAVVNVPSTSSGEAEFQAVSASATAGGATTVGAVRLELVGGIEAGAFFVKTRGLDVNANSRALLLAAIAGTRIRYRFLNRFGAFVAADLNIPIQRANFSVQGAGNVVTLSSVGFSGRVGLEVLF